RHTIIHAMASLVRVASSTALQPPRTAAHRVAHVRRTKMDARHHQRLRSTMGLSEDSDLTDNPQGVEDLRDGSGSLAIFTAIRRASWPVGFRFAERAAKLFDEGAGCQQV